jgi:hypothetical protein
LSYKEKQKPRGQGAAGTSGRNWATWQPAGYTRADAAAALQAYQASLQHYVTADQAAKMAFGKEVVLTPQQQMAKYYAELRARGTGVSPTPAQANLATYKKQWAKWQAGQAGYKGPPTQPTALPPPGKGSPMPDYLKGMLPETGEWPAYPMGELPAAAPEYAGGGYGGYGYPYYGWGGGRGDVNINFGGGRAQQQIARLPTTPQPDIQGWLQSLINWNIGG